MKSAFYPSQETETTRQCLCEGGMLKESEEIFKTFGSRRANDSVDLDLVIPINIMIDAAAKAGNPERAFVVLKFECVVPFFI